MQARAQISENAENDLIDYGPLKSAQVGICIQDFNSGKYIYEYQDDKYFTPASNTKIVTLYTGLSLLGDSTSGIRYQFNGDTLYIQGTGDPSLLHADYTQQPVFDFLKANSGKVLALTRPVDENEPYGPGWSWDDYDADYQPQRSSLPLYGDVLWCTVANRALVTVPAYFQKTDSLLEDTLIRTHSFRVRRGWYNNRFYYHIQTDLDTNTDQVPFILYGERTTAVLLEDTLHEPVIYDSLPATWTNAGILKNIPADSLYSHMMLRSDNFFAEQLLEMCSYLQFDTISTEKITSYMLDNKLADLPDKPAWVDGSGLSRFNLFTPRDLVAVLGKLYREFPKERLFHIFETGGEGTLTNHYQTLAGYIYAKTGSLNNNAALSGYLITQKGNTLLFSILVGNYMMRGSELRSQIEKFITSLWEED